MWKREHCFPPSFREFLDSTIHRTHLSTTRTAMTATRALSTLSYDTVNAYLGSWSVRDYVKYRLKVHKGCTAEDTCQWGGTAPRRLSGQFLWRLKVVSLLAQYVKMYTGLIYCCAFGWYRIFVILWHEYSPRNGALLVWRKCLHVWKCR